ncbi:MAG TPA: hypothetical protein VFY04_06800 [Solirubrobacterales bacterium]|nr:hypothetical protein [Solirubrobacterales bacterium]
MLPKGWIAQGGDAFVRAFSMVGIAQRDLSPPIQLVFDDVCVLMMWTALPRLAVENALEIRSNGEVIVNLNTPDGAASHAEGPVALFVAHPDLSENAGKATIRTEEVIAQITTLGSLLLAFEHLEDYWIKFPGGALSGASRVILDTTWWEEPNLSKNARDGWQLAQAAIASSAEPDRLHLSLRWLDEAKRSEATDALLKLWFALEILTGTSDRKAVARIDRALSAAYEISREQVSSQFGIGRIFGLRSKIVHHGLKVHVPGPLLNYVAGIYVDLLVSLLGFQLAGRARARCEEAGGIDNLLPSVVGGRAEEKNAERAAEKDQEHDDGEVGPFPSLGRGAFNLAAGPSKPSSGQ